MMRWNRTIVRRLFWLASFGWMGLIFWFSAQNAEKSAESSGSVMTFLLRLFKVDSMEEILTDTVLYSMVDFALRKSAHFAVFGILGILLCITISLYPNAIRLQKIVLPLSLGILYACIDELHQYFVPGRACQIRDVCIDTAGVLVGVLLVLWLGRRIRRRREKKQAAAAQDTD
ncbi:MAG: VanZ family protein [Clostridia bacterium]|nr:VanZ family protein [Clostridia bacterium]